MSAPLDITLDRRVVVLAPTQRDADVTVALLADAGMAAGACASLELAIAEVQRGAAALLLPEEALGGDGARHLAALAAAQPPWSDLPLLLLTFAGADSAAAAHATGTLGNVTLLERPLRVGTLISAARTALRARERQYQVRDHLAERARAEAALRESESKYRTLFTTMAQGFTECEIIRDPSGRAVEFRLLDPNPAFEQLVGTPPSEAKGRTAREVIPGLEDWWVAAFDDVVARRQPRRIERDIPQLGRYYEVHAYPGLGDRFIILFDDITERKQAELARRKSEERQTFLLTLSDDFRARPDEAAVGLTCVQMLAAYLGAERCYITELSTELRRGVVGPEYCAPGFGPIAGVHHYASYPDGIRDLLDGRPFVAGDVRHDPALSVTDRQSIAEGLGLGAMISAPLSRGSGNSIWSLSVGTAAPRAWTADDLRLVQDVGERTWAAIERARAERALQEAHDALEQRVRERTAEVRALFVRLIAAQEEERRRIARDIHDQLGQQMTALRMNLEVLTGQVEHEPRAVAQAHRTMHRAEELDQSIDHLTWALRPAALDHLGFAAALAQLVTGWSERFGIEADLDAGQAGQLRLAPEKEANLYRLAQEALHNVFKHAHATRVSVSLTRQGDDLRLVIADNGRGFEMEKVGPSPGRSGLGLVSMWERAEIVGGRLTITSKPGSGTTVAVKLPIDAADRDPA